jgi:hypothetical protein
MVEEPVYWQVSFGKFTPKKFYLMCDLSGLQPAFFNTISGLNVYTVINAGVLLTRYLAEQKAAGTPVLYEDGTEMRTDDY